MKFLPVILLLFLTATTLCAETKVLLPDPAKVAADENDIFVATSIPGDFTTMEGILTALLFLADQAADETLTNPFLPHALSSTSQFEGALPLGAYFRGVVRSEGAITISFSSEAMRYLNSTVTIQQCTKGAIERTLLHHFPKIETIEYRIDGTIISGWDA